MSDIDSRVLLAMYGAAAGSAVARFFALAAAQWLVFLVPLALAGAWWWPAAARGQRRRALVACGIAGALAVVVTLVLAAAVDRARPFVALDLVPLFPHPNDSSFPSDHTMLGVALPAPLAWQGHRLGWLLVGVGLLAGFGRVAAAVHWPSDILGTALLAAGLGPIALSLSEFLLRRAPHAWVRRFGISPRPPEVMDMP